MISYICYSIREWHTVRMEYTFQNEYKDNSKQLINQTIFLLKQEMYLSFSGRF